MSKFIKVLIIINGTIIPVLIISFGIYLIAAYFKPNDYVPEVVKTDNIIVQDGDTLVAQGLRYTAPMEIYNSTNFYISVKPKTFKNPGKIESRDESRSLKLRYEGASSSEYDLNILFLDNKYRVTGRLLDKKAAIKVIDIPVGRNSTEIDTTVNNIAYQIAFNDDNEDGQIDDSDNFDLYISDLNGKELTRITNGIDVLSFAFINHHSELFITYRDRSDMADEYKVERFAVYTIDSKQYRKLTDIDKALNGIQKILN